MATTARAQSLARQTLSIARMPLQMAQWRTRSVGAPAPGVPLTVFVHGYMATAGVLDPLAVWLAERGVAPFQLHFSYAPAGAVDTLARELDAHIARLGHEGPVRLVGHSLGGLIGRYRTQVLRRPLERLVCIATPHAGTTRARLGSAFPLARELVPGSDLLRLLDATAGHLAGTRVVSLVAASDWMVAPVQSAQLAGHRTVWLKGLGHNSVLYAREAWREVELALAAYDEPPEHASPAQ